MRRFAPITQPRRIENVTRKPSFSSKTDGRGRKQDQAAGAPEYPTGKLRLLPAKGERAKRTHHLCDMGGAIQAISPEADQLPKTQFYCLMERVFALPEVRRLVQQAQEEG